MLSNTPGKKRNEYVSDYVVFDLETTGISAAFDKVVEISGVKVMGGKVVEEFSTLVNPEKPIPYAASNVNHIYDHMVKDCPTFDVALKDFLDFAGDFVLVGHNIHSFDMKFIKRDAEKYWGKTIGNDYIDTLAMARVCLPQLSSRTLTALAQYYGISSDGAHRALNDCRMNQQVYERLGKEKKHISTGNEKICPKCGQNMVKRSGKFGEFFGCAGFPLCRYTENV